MIELRSALTLNIREQEYCLPSHHSYNLRFLSVLPRVLFPPIVSLSRLYSFSFGSIVEFSVFK